VWGNLREPGHPTRWDKPERVEKGSYGSFLFDHAQTTYLLANQLCTLPPARRVVVGWLVAGDRVGLPRFELGE
jgi:hypothetical protein